jgi:hypothetical protein
MGRAKVALALGTVTPAVKRTGETDAVLVAAFAGEANNARGTTPATKAPAATPASIDLLDRIALDNAFPFDASVRRRSDVGFGQTSFANRAWLYAAVWRDALWLTSGW